MEIAFHKASSANVGTKGPPIFALNADGGFLVGRLVVPASSATRQPMTPVAAHSEPAIRSVRWFHNVLRTMLT